MNIFIYELKMYRKSIIIWSSSLLVMLILFMSIYPTFSADASLMEIMLENYPEEFIKAFGMGGNLPMSTIPGYFNFIFVYMQLCIAIQSSNYGFHFLSVEERELTADFLMSKPVSRKKLLFSKFAAAFTALTTVNIVIWIGSFVSIELFKGDSEYDISKMIILMSATVFFQLFFLNVGMLISVSLKKIRSVLAFSMALSCGLYIMNALRDVFGGELLGIISPFYHFAPGYILEFGKYNIGKAAISFTVILVSMIISYVLYLRRNIHSL